MDINLKKEKKIIVIIIIIGVDGEMKERAYKWKDREEG